MPRLRVFSGRELCRLLHQHGFEQVRQSCSHIILQRKQDEATTTVPVPNHKEVRVGTLRSIIRQSGLPREVFEE